MRAQGTVHQGLVKIDSDPILEDVPGYYGMANNIAFAPGAKGTKMGSESNGT